MFLEHKIEKSKYKKTTLKYTIFASILHTLTYTLCLWNIQYSRCTDVDLFQNGVAEGVRYATLVVFVL